MSNDESPEKGAAALAGFKGTWSAYQRDVDTQRLNTDIVREGWPKPTIYREHETIHVLCNLIDNLRRELRAQQRMLELHRDALVDKAFALAAVVALANEWAETPDEDMTCGWASDQIRAAVARVIPPGGDHA